MEDLKRMERFRLHEQLVEKVKREMGQEEFAEYCSAVHQMIEQHARDNDVGPHGAQAACYMVANGIADKQSEDE